MKKEETQELTNAQKREKATKKIQHYSKFVPSDDINTPEELAEWLNDDEWEWPSGIDCERATLTKQWFANLS